MICQLLGIRSFRMKYFMVEGEQAKPQKLILSQMKENNWRFCEKRSFWICHMWKELWCQDWNKRIDLFNVVYIFLGEFMPLL